MTASSKGDNYDNDQKKAHSRRDLPPDRSTQFFANERTFLAWLRTSIAIIGLGFVVARFSLFLREFGFVMSQRAVSNLNNNNSSQGSSSVSAASLQDLLTSGTHSPSSIIGLSMVGLGVLLIAYALFNYKRAHEIIERGEEYYISKHSIMYLASIGLIAFGIIVIVYLMLASV